MNQPNSLTGQLLLSLKRVQAGEISTKEYNLSQACLCKIFLSQIKTAKEWETQDNEVHSTLIINGPVLFSLAKSYNGKYSYLKPFKADEESLVNDGVANAMMSTNCCGSKQKNV